MNFRYSTILRLSVCAFALCGCNGHSHEADNENKDSEHSHNKDEIVVEHATAERFGVGTDTVRVGSPVGSIKVSGLISSDPAGSAIISAPTAGILHFSSGISEGKSIGAGTTIATVSAKDISGGDSNLAAKARLDAAKRELDRITPLHAEGIVSTRDFNAARQTYEEARAAYSPNAATGTAKSPVAGAITALMATNGQYVSAGEPIAAVSANGKLVLRADLPEKYYTLLPDISSAKLRTAYSGEVIDLATLNCRRITSSTDASAGRPGYIPVVFAFDNKDGRLMAGTTVEVFLLTGHTAGESESGISIPVSALSEQQGNYFVYLKHGDHSFVKTLVKTGEDDGEYISIISGLKPGDVIVVKGTSIVRMAETSGVAPEGHHHH